MLEHRGLGARLRTAGGGRTRREQRWWVWQNPSRQGAAAAAWWGRKVDWSGLSTELSEEGNGEAGHLEKLHFEEEQRNERGSGFQRQAILPCDPEREATGEGARGERGLEQRWGAGCP